MKKFECNDCGGHCSVTIYRDYITPCSCLHDKKHADWQEVKETVTDYSQLPKLTAEVFNRPDCPEWAKYAAVDCKGYAWWYKDVPTRSVGGGWFCDDTYWKGTYGIWDASDWQNSLIERPVKASPDWCKAGKHGFDNEQKRYFEIVHIYDKWVDIEYLDDGNGETVCRSDMQKCSEAQKCPFNKKEMRKLVGKVFTTPDGDVSIATDFNNIMNSICICSEWFKGDELANSIWQLDGKPCFKLEHLNEKEEWVE